MPHPSDVAPRSPGDFSKVLATPEPSYLSAVRSWPLSALEIAWVEVFCPALPLLAEIGPPNQTLQRFRMAGGYSSSPSFCRRACSAAVRFAASIFRKL